VKCCFEAQAWQEIEDIILKVEAGELKKIDDIFVVEGHGSVRFGSLVSAGIGDSHIPSNRMVPRSKVSFMILEPPFTFGSLERMLIRGYNTTLMDSQRLNKCIFRK
jgi:hypothetical protein